MITAEEARELSEVNKDKREVEIEAESYERTVKDIKNSVDIGNLKTSYLYTGHIYDFMPTKKTLERLENEGYRILMRFMHHTFT